jgi:hypothetical protein
MTKNSNGSRKIWEVKKIIIYSAAILIGLTSGCTLRYHNGYDPGKQAKDNKDESRIASMFDAGDYFIKTQEWERAIEHYERKFELDNGGEWQDYFVVAFSNYQLAFQNFTMIGLNSNDSFGFDSNSFATFGDMFLDNAVDNCWEARRYMNVVSEIHDEKELHGESVGKTREGIDFLCDKVERIKYGTELVR